MARDLGPLHPDGPRDSIDDRLVRRWSSGQRDIPDWVASALTALLEGRRAEVGREMVLLDEAHRVITNTRRTGR